MRRVGGFILIEIVIVAVIIGIFAAVAYPSYLRFIRDGQVQQAKAVMNAIATAERIGFENNGKFVTMGDGVWVDVATPATATYGSGLYSVGSNKIDTGDAPIFQFNVSSIINDPINGKFTITAQGRGKDKGGLETSETVTYVFDAANLTQRDTWGGTLLACSNC